MPSYGGQYREGIIADSINSITPSVKKLTKIGLVAYDKEGKIKPDLAASWEISSDQKIYTFHLQNDINPNELIDIIHKEKPNWSDIELVSPDPNTIQFKLKQPYAPLLNNLTEPIFPYGPYKVDKENKSEIILVARDNTKHDKPYMQKIILKLYPNYDNLLKALKAKQIDGGGPIDNQNDVSNKFNFQELKLSRYVIAFFNLNNNIWQKKEIRQKLAKNENIGANINATVATSDKGVNMQFAQQLQDKWKALGVNLDIKTYSIDQLQSEIIPKRQYDVLIYGLDYGSDPDLYPFWHSSQITDKGLNLSNFSNVDGDKLLEEARQTINESDRSAKYESFQKILNEEVPAITLEQDVWGYALSTDIKGVQTDFKAFNPSDRFFQIEKWYVQENRVRK